MREGYGTWFVIRSLINPRRMREGYGTCFVIRSFIHSVHRAAEISDHFYALVR